MYIFLGIVGEIATVVGSVAINLNGASNSILEIAKKGYKVNKNVLEEYQKKHAEEAKEKSNGFNGVLAIVLLFVPGVNLLRSCIFSFKMKKEIMNLLQIKNALIPMTDREKAQYAEMKGKMQKLAFVSFIAAKENEEEVQGVVEETKQSHIDDTTSANLEPVQTQIIFEQAPVSAEEEETIVEDQQGPVLKKILYPKDNKIIK